MPNKINWEEFKSPSPDARDDFADNFSVFYFPFLISLVLFFRFPTCALILSAFRLFRKDNDKFTRIPSQL